MPMTDQEIVKILKQKGFKEFQDWEFSDGDLWVTERVAKWLAENTKVYRGHLNVMTSL